MSAKLHASQKSMVFHYPYPLPREQRTGREVRLNQMLGAFKAAGYHVDPVIGYAPERRAAIACVVDNARQGQKYDFLYSEASTSPSLFSKKNILYPLLDTRFFLWCRRQGIPTGVFYRDLHWRFGYSVPGSWCRRVVGYFLYWFDWWSYRHSLDHLFLPSLPMREHLPTHWERHRVSALFPGCPFPKVEKRPVDLASRPLRLFYVGGVIPPLYDLRAAIDTVQSLEKVSLTLCCRKAEWEQSREYYSSIDLDKVMVVHAEGEQLRAYYQDADLFLLFRSPHPYLDFAMQVKLFESLGHGVPVVVNAGTEASRFVAEEDIGWVVSSKEELRCLLVSLTSRQLIARRTHLLKVRERHTWEMRAHQVAAVLTGQEWN